MDTFTLHVDLDTPVPERPALDLLRAELDEYGGACSGRRGRLQVSLNLTAATLRQATLMGITLVQDAVEQAGLGRPEAVGIIAGELTDMGIEIPELLSTTQVAAKLRISRQAMVMQAHRLGGVKVGEAWVYSAAAVRAYAARRRK